MATGLQDRFSFAGVAAAGVGAGIGAYVAGTNFVGGIASRAGQEAIISSANAIASAATRSAIDGSNFGDNIIAAIPDVIGQAIGSAIGNGISGAIGDPYLSAEKQAQIDGAISTGLARMDRDVTDEIIVTGTRKIRDWNTNYYASLSGLPNLAKSESDASYYARKDVYFEQLLANKYAIAHNNFADDWNRFADSANKYSVSTFSVEDNANIVATETSPWWDTDISLDNLPPSTKLDVLAGIMNREYLESQRQTAKGIGIGGSLIGGPMGYGFAGMTIAIDYQYTGKVSKWDAGLMAVPGLKYIPAGISKIRGLVRGESATELARRLGREGEGAVGYIGKKERVTVPGSTHYRISDGITRSTLSEVKNVARQGLTKQLKDYQLIAKDKGLNFDLYVRGPKSPLGQTTLTGPLVDAIDAGAVNLRFIPGTY